MTTTAVDLPVWVRRSQADLVRDQVAAIAAFHQARRAAAPLADPAAIRAASREDRLDLARRMDVLRRQHQALIERTEQQLRESARLLRTAPPVRAVVVHRSDWFKGKVVEGLLEGGVEVVARLDNGADAVGVTVAEQPDLLLVEDKLPMISGEEVIRQVLQLAPHTVTAAQVSFDEGVAALLDAGARTAFTRRVPPAEVARDLCELVRV